MDKIGSINIERRAPVPPPAPEKSPWVGVRSVEEVPMANRPEIKMKALKTFLSNDGGRLTKDAEYTLHSEREALEHVQKGLGERLSAPAPSDSEDSASEGSAQTVPEDEPWKLQISPEAYLEKWPDGPNAAQARAEIARKGGKIAPAGE
jgi:hypothetical protein